MAHICSTAAAARAPVVSIVAVHPGVAILVAEFVGMAGGVAVGSYAPNQVVGSQLAPDGKKRTMAGVLRPQLRNGFVGGPLPNPES